MFQLFICSAVHMFQLWMAWVKEDLGASETYNCDTHANDHNTSYFHYNKTDFQIPQCCPFLLNISLPLPVSLMLPDRMPLSRPFSVALLPAVLGKAATHTSDRLFWTSHISSISVTYDTENNQFESTKYQAPCQ
jgi:hypothetical protein